MKSITRKGDISPPPLKRQKLEQPSTSPKTTATKTPGDFTPLHHPTPGCLRVFSWNINGIAPFVQPYIQQSIKSFFLPTHPGRKRRRQNDADIASDSEDMEDNADTERRDSDPSKEGLPSLRLALQRYAWPHIFFLQEVKIKPGDDTTIRAVRQAVNDVLHLSKKHQLEARTSSNAPNWESSINTLADGGPAYDVYFNLPADPQNAKAFGGKVYGVATIICKDLVSQHVDQIRDVEWDREGRVQIVETREISMPLQLNNHTLLIEKGAAQEHTSIKLAIVNIYAVNGTSNPYRSVYTGTEVGTRHDRKLAVHTDLLIEVKALEAQGFQVIIAGDLNIARNELDGYPNLRTRPSEHIANRNDFNSKFFTDKTIDISPSKAAFSSKYTVTSSSKKIRGFGGIDTFRHIHKTQRRYSYHPRGIVWGASCDRVDLIITSASLAENIVNAGIYDSPRDRGPSDHCPIWVEIGSI